MTDWRFEAACLDSDPELFFPIGNTGVFILQIEEAKDVCRQCDVVATCLRWALDTGQDAGVWGAMSEDERRAMKRRKGRLRAAERVDHGPVERPPRSDKFVPAEPTRARLQEWVDAGHSIRALQARFGITSSTVQRLLTGQQASVAVGSERAVLGAELGPAQQAVNA